MGMQATQELRQRQSLATIEVRGPKDFLKLGIQQLAAVTEVHDLHGLLQADLGPPVLVIHNELNDIEESPWLTACRTLLN